jgi:hypothetical protein
MNIFEIWKQIATLNFCYFATPQQMNIRLLHTEYYEYINVFNIFKQKYPNYNGMYNVDEYKVLPEKMKDDITVYAKKQRIVRDRLIEHCKLYCIDYPNEKLAQNRFLKEYDEYPYRLHQNIETIIENLE